MTVRVVTGVDQDIRGRIVALYGEPDAEWSPISTREAVESMRAGVHSYVSVGRRGSADIHAFNGSWVRTTRNLVYEDNLDNLGGPNYSHYGAGSFGLAVTLSPDGVEALARELHASGAVIDRLAVHHGGLFVTALLGVPRFEPVAGGASFEVVRDAICHVRPANDPQAPGVSVVATITALCTVGTRVPARLGVADFTLTYSVPPQGAVRLESPVSGEAREAVLQSFTTWVAASRVDRWDLPLNGLLTGASRVDAELSAGGHARVGFRFDGKRVGEFSPARSEFDWTVALSRPFVVARIGEAMRAYLGGLPAPLGTDWRVYVPGIADVMIRYLEVGLIPGAVVISGIAVQGRSSAVSATFTAQFSLALDVDGLITATLGDTTVEVVEWYAKIADFLSGGTLVEGVQDGLRTALGAIGADVASGLLRPDLLTRIVAAGTARQATVVATPRRVWIEPGAMHLGGDFDRAPVAPQVDAVALGRRVDITPSATPGSTIREIRWEADGVTRVETFEQRTVSWTPPTGASSVTVTVITDEGEQSVASATLQ
jgi:hypothetical protein